jgi:hypothetical protein
MAVQSDDEDDTKNGATLLVPTNSAFDVRNIYQQLEPPETHRL